MLENRRLAIGLILASALIGGTMALPGSVRAPAAALVRVRSPRVSSGDTPVAARNDRRKRHLAECLEDLRSSSAVRRRAAAMALRILREPAAVPDLRRVARDVRDEPCRREAAAALAGLGDPEGERILVDLSRTGRDRYQALAALGEARGDLSRRRLDEVLDGPDHVLKPAAVTAMVRRGDSGWERVIAEGLGSARWDLREAALAALRDRGEGDFSDALRAALHSETEGVRLAAAEALLVRGDAGARAMLESALGSADRRVRGEAARVLAQHGADDALPTIERAYVEGGPADRLSLLGRVAAKPSPLMVPFLRRVAATGLMVERIAAASGLAALGDDRTLEVIEEAMECGNELLRARALLARSRLLAAGERREP